MVWWSRKNTLHDYKCLTLSNAVYVYKKKLYIYIFRAYPDEEHIKYIPLSIDTANSMIINLKPCSIVLHFYDIVHPLFKCS